MTCNSFLVLVALFDFVSAFGFVFDGAIGVDTFDNDDGTAVIVVNDSGCGFCKDRRCSRPSSHTLKVAICNGAVAPQVELRFTGHTWLNTRMQNVGSKSWLKLIV